MRGELEAIMGSTVWCQGEEVTKFPDRPVPHVCECAYTGRRWSKGHVWEQPSELEGTLALHRSR